MSERQVYLGEVERGAAIGALAREGIREVPISDVENAVPKFKTKDFNSFRAEYGTVEDNLVVHFYLPQAVSSRVATLGAGAQKQLSDWWASAFPGVLSDVAKEHFKADYPRLVAKYTEEVASWWFRASGFAHAFAPDALLEEFLRKLDAQLSVAST